MSSKCSKHMDFNGGTEIFRISFKYPYPCFEDERKFYGFRVTFINV